MKSGLRDILAYALGLLAKTLTPRFQRYIVGLCVDLAADVPRLGSTWVVRFANPVRSGKCHSIAIDASLQQFGRFVRGTGHIQGRPGDPFAYHGVIRRNVFYGTFQRVDSHNLAGTGTFVLKISPNARRMTGQCTWYDNHLDATWSSAYTWLRR